MKSRSDIAAGDIVRMNYHAYRVAMVEGDPSYGERFTLFAHQLSGQQVGRKIIATIPAHAMITFLDEHFPICRLCGEVPPCRESQQDRAALAATKRMDERMNVPDGWCMACSEPITHRQQTHSFPGPNVWNPLGSDGVRFHARQSCRDGASAYENDWITADPNRERSLLTLKCPGTITVHGDGSAECSRPNDCPHIYARHSHYAACYLFSPCLRGCDENTHRGTALAKNLLPDGTFPL